MRESLEELVVGGVLIPGRGYEKLVFKFLWGAWIGDGLLLLYGSGRWWSGRSRGLRRIWKKIRVGTC